MTARKRRLEARIVAAMEQAAAERRLDVADHLLKALEALNAREDASGSGAKPTVHYP